jgi:beta-glucosidase
VADVLFGNAVPSGKLPLTFPRSLAQLPPFEDYSMAGRTYRYLTEDPLYPFGFGLSYTQFVYRDLKAPAQLKAGQPLTFSFTLSNSGAVASEEIVQVYISDLQASLPVPLQSLVAFRRVPLQPGESQVVSFELSPEALMLVDEAGELVLEPGQFKLYVGGCSPSKRGLALGAPQPLEMVFETL